MAVDVTSGAGAPVFQSGTPRELFTKPDFKAPALDGYLYDVAPDGKRFLVVTQTGTASSPATVVVNWQSQLRK